MRCRVEHMRHRSIFNFMVNILAALTAYTLQPKKPSVHVNSHEMALLAG